MASRFSLSRRAFLAATAAAPLAFGAKKVPVGLELYSVRDQLKQDLLGTVRKVGQMGYECVEFYSPYYDWTPDQAKEVRKLLDDLNVKCYSTHNSLNALQPEGIQKAIDLNGIIGSKYVVAASAGRVTGLDGWKTVAETLSRASDTLKKSKMQTGFHNHQVEFRALEGKRPIDVISENTPKNVILQMDVGTILEVGEDPVAYINKNPGRIKSIHCKEYSRDGKGYKVLFGEGSAPWKEIFAAAEKTGGVEFYLIEQEGSDLPPFETVEKCLANFRKMRQS
ncbi:MAG TPA: sugar phosphate isomerase/epimerase [Bryobacteraceae bacterium]|nr:sugar phosphate isomerase/epimerase [Bryobacteraceae bacterium]